MFASRWRPYLVLAIGVLAVSSSSVLIRFAQDQGAPSLVISAWRLALAALFLTPLVLARHRADVAALSRRQIGFIALGGVLLGIHFASWITSLEYTSVAASAVLVTTNPLWVALAAPFLLRERLSRWTMIGVVVAVVGAIIISTAGGSGTAIHQGDPALGDVLALIGAVAFAGYLIVGRKIRGGIPLIPYIWLTYGMSAIVLIVAVIATHQQVVGLTPSAYLWMTLIAAIPQMIGHSSYNYALGYLSAAYVGLTIVGEPVGSTILAVPFLHEPVYPLQLVGGVLILVAVAVASREEAQHQIIKADEVVSSE